MRQRLATLLAVGALLTGMLATTGGIAIAANQSANLDQCANDPSPSPDTDGCNSNASQWVNGNLGSSKSLYFEGDTIPYRMTLTNLVTGGTVHHLTIEWDTTKGGKHAIDYLDTFNQTVANANPCLGVSGCAPGTFGVSGTIPVDPQVSGAGVTPISGVFRIYGGAIGSLTRPTNVGSTACNSTNSLGSYCYSTGTGFAGDKSAAITINFTASVANPVIAWGGHIATRRDWGQGNSAGAVSGSPYHMRLIDLDGAGGNQDRSLSADAVVLLGSITIIKDVVGGTDPQDFTFTETAATTLPPATFTLDDDPGSVTPTNTQTYTGISNFISYTFDEGAVANWSLSFNNPPCTVTSPNGGTQPLHSTTGVTINLKEGENVTCTFLNTHNFNTTQLSTTPSETTGKIGDTLSDSATLTGATTGAGGTISFYLFAPGATCDDTAPITGFVYSSTGVPVSGNDTYASSAGTTKTGSAVTTGAGTYTWVAVYSGDGNNNASKSACGSEDVVIGPNTTQLSTTPSETKGIIGDTLTDTATLTGATTGATGTISFYLFAPGATCDDTSPITGFVYSATGVPVSGNSTYSSTDATGTTGSNVTTVAGTYTWVAVYTDGADNVSSKSGCGSEDVAIAPNTTQLSTTPSETTGKIGDTLSDSATLTGATTGAGGTISFYLFAPGATCDDTAPITGFVYSSTGVPVSGNDTYASSAGTTKTGSAVTTGAGTYTWVAVYTDGADNVSSKSGCGSEDVAIAPNTTQLSTTPSETTGKIGDTLSDSATLTGATTGAGGTISFYLFAPGATCDDTSPITGFVYSATGVPVSGNSTYSSTDATGTTGSNVTTVAGTYTWVAVYTDGADNVSSKSGCGSEDVAIAPNAPDLSTTTNETKGIIGDALTDSATLSGSTTGAGTSIDFYLFDPNTTCSTDGTGAVYSSTGVPVSGDGTYQSSDGTESGSNAATMAGTYTWVAVYTGDANNTGTNTACGSEDVAIAPNAPDLSTTTNETKGIIGDALTDSATLSGSTTGAGTSIDFYLFDPNTTCSTDGTGAVYSSTGVPVSGDGTYQSSDGTESGSNAATMAGTYTWVAVYTGDANNTGTNTACGDEDVAIAKNSPDISTTPNLLPNDEILVSGLTDDATGVLTVELHTNADCTGSAVYTQVWDSTLAAPDKFTGNGTYDTTNATVFVNASETIRWCTTYSGDSNNEAFGPSDKDEVIQITFNPVLPAAAIGFGIPMLLWGFRNRKKRNAKD